MSKKEEQQKRVNELNNNASKAAINQMWWLKCDKAQKMLLGKKKPCCYRISKSVYIGIQTSGFRYVIVKSRMYRITRFNILQLKVELTRGWMIAYEDENGMKITRFHKYLRHAIEETFDPIPF